jgi:DNA mismatch repair protein MutS
MFRQYLRIKSQYQDAILFYRMGDFYEMFFDDARTASRVLSIALTSRDKDRADPVPMCGVPFHAAENYIARLVREGHKVAVCEQIGEIPRGSKLARREVVRIVTPGTILTEGFLPEKRNNFMAALVGGPHRIGAAFLDVSTGDFVAASLPADRGDAVPTLLAEFEPSELLLPPGDSRLAPHPLPAPAPRVGHLAADDLDAARSRGVLLDHFGMGSLEPFGLGQETPEAVIAAGALLSYALETQKQPLAHVQRIRLLADRTHLVMDAATQRNLELTRSAADGGKEGTLLAVLDETLTPMGGRLLRQWLTRPLLSLEEIRARLAAVEELVSLPLLAEELGDRLRGILDLERLLGRLTVGQAGPRDLLSLGRSLTALPQVRSSLERAASALLVTLRGKLDPLEDLAGLIASALRDEAPVSTREGGFIRQGFDADLDGWLSLKRDGRSWLASFEEAERLRTGIATLKVRYNRVFGYYIEITKANLAQAPPDYLRKQTLVGAERFTAPPLAEFESRILEAEERCLALEQEIFARLRQRILDQGGRIAATGSALAELDVLLSLAKTAVRRDYRRPLVDDGDTLLIREGRHPVVEALNPAEPFIPNDLLLNGGDRQIAIITGPNMAGKSTYLRQVALIVLLAQMGSFVPAAEARIGLVDRIFTRVGATDFLVRGQSTFMVEMTETAAILHNATPRSLVILDEIGRGTSTFDGLSLAWAVAEYLHDRPEAKARTLFATHYHQLTELALTREGIRNYSTAVREWQERIIFLRKIVEGGTDRSYGIQVARLAGLPPRVIDRALEIMANLEREEFTAFGQPRLAAHESGGDTPAPPLVPGNQLSLFPPPGDEALERLRALSPEEMTPLQALNALDELVKLAKKKKS